MSFSVRKLKSLTGALLGACGLFLAAQDTAAAPKATPAQGQTKVTNKPASPKAALVDVNHASKATLMTLQGIDGSAADRIIAGRPYLTKADLVTKKVLSMGAFQAVRTRIVAGGAAAALKKAQGK